MRTNRVYHSVHIVHAIHTILAKFPLGIRFGCVRCSNRKSHRIDCVRDAISFGQSPLRHELRCANSKSNLYNFLLLSFAHSLSSSLHLYPLQCGSLQTSVRGFSVLLRWNDIDKISLDARIEKRELKSKRIAQINRVDRSVMSISIIIIRANESFASARSEQILQFQIQLQLSQSKRFMPFRDIFHYFFTREIVEEQIESGARAENFVIEKLKWWRQRSK